LLATDAHGNKHTNKQPHTVKNLLLRKSIKGKSWIDLTMMERVGDRKKWKDLVRQAKAHGGL
jgi:hypothetical protein